MGITVTTNNQIPRLVAALRKLGKTGIEVGIFGDDDAELVKIAGVHEYGMTIKPKNGKFLAIPLPAAKGKRPADFGDELFFMPSKDDNRAYLARKRGKGKREKIEPMFVLMKSVKIPERSFIRSGFDESVDEITKKIEKHLQTVLDFKINPDIFLDMIGTEFAGMIQKKARKLKTPANAPLTVANKRSSNPLMDTGRMVGAIRHKVVDD